MYNISSLTFGADKYKHIILISLSTLKPQKMLTV